MPSAHVHYAFGLMIAYFLGYRGWKNMKMSVYAIAPDFDVFTNMLLFLILAVSKVDHGTYVLLNDLLGHRGFSHSITFILVVMGIAYLVTRNRKTVGYAGILMGSHLLLDYTISWELRPFFPFHSGRFESSTVEFIDPVINIVALLFIIAFVFHWAVLREKYIMKHGERYKRFKKRFPGIVRYTFVFLCVYMLALFAGKAIALYSREGWDTANYNETMSTGFYQYVYCVDHNGNHWRVVDFSLFSTDEDTTYVEKVGISANDTATLSALNLSVKQVVDRCAGLLDSQARYEQMLDYYVFRIDFEDDNTTICVKAHDARMDASGVSPGHSKGFIFEFENGDLEHFKAYHGEGSFDRGKIPTYHFE